MENARNDTAIGIIAMAYLLLKLTVTTIILLQYYKLRTMDETTSKSPDNMTWKQAIVWIIGALLVMGGAVYAAYKTTEHFRSKQQPHEDSLKIAEPSYSQPARSSGKGKGLLHGLHVSLPELPGLPGIKIAYHVRLV